MVGEGEAPLLGWIVSLPLASALVHLVALGLLRRPLPRTASVGLSCGAPLLSFVLAFQALLELIERPPAERVFNDGLFTWIAAGDFGAEVGFLLDPLSAVMALLVTGVGSLVHVHAVGSMTADAREDRGFDRFFAYLNLLLFSMLVVVLGDNLLLVFLGWQGVGLFTSLLVGFWYADDANAASARKAFIVGRIGDFAFLVGLFVLFWSLADAGRPTVGLADLASGFAAIADAALALPGWLGGSWPLPEVIGLCFLLAAMARSAQLPLHVWAPDAAAAPMPAAALVHAVTSLPAGAYLVCRLSFAYAAAPLASDMLAWAGAATALLGALAASGQSDLRRVLAYAAISQLGLVFLAAGVGAHAAAVFTWSPTASSAPCSSCPLRRCSSRSRVSTTSIAWAAWRGCFRARTGCSRSASPRSPEPRSSRASSRGTRSCSRCGSRGRARNRWGSTGSAWRWPSSPPSMQGASTSAASAA